MALPDNKRDALVEKVAEEVVRQANETQKDFVTRDVPAGEAKSIVEDGIARGFGRFTRKQP